MTDFQNTNPHQAHSKNTMVYLRAVTWSRDSHGLFDYESRHISKKNLRTAVSGKLISTANEVQLIPLNRDSPELAPGVKPLLNLKNEEGSFYIENCNKERENQEKLWLVVRSLKTSQGKIDYKIKKGDIMKLGRVKLKVREYKTEDPSTQKDTESADDAVEVKEVRCAQPKTPGKDGAPEDTCRFCWMTECTEANPLLSTCKCMGTMQYIHYLCLKEWLSTKMSQKKTSNMISFYWKTFECEICKDPYPYIIKCKARRYNLVEIDKPEGNHIILESLNLDKNSSRMVHVIIANQSKKTFRFGRGHDSDVRISDISVSRCHAIIKYINGQFYLEDNLSKFGTLVLVRSPLELETNFTKAVQIGRTVISFNVKNLSASGEKQTSAVQLENHMEEFGASKKKGHGGQHAPHDPSKNTNAQHGGNQMRNPGEPYSHNHVQNMMGMGGLFFLQGNQFTGPQMPILPPNMTYAHPPFVQQEFYFSQPVVNQETVPVAMDIDDNGDNDEEYQDEGIRNTK